MSLQVCYCGRPPRCLHTRMALPSARPFFLMSERCPLYSQKRTSRSTLINLADDRALPVHGSDSDVLALRR